MPLGARETSIDDEYPTSDPPGYAKDGRPLNDQIWGIQEQYYTSDLYKYKLTPEFIRGAKPHRLCKPGQIPWPKAEWSYLDSLYMNTNHWYHAENDKIQFRCFNTFLNHAPLFQQPGPDWTFYTQRKYDDDILGQFAGASIVGLQMGTLFGWFHTHNAGQAAGIYQTMGMPANRWLPMHVADYSFRLRIVLTCQAQCATFFGAVALTDAILSKIRKKDDIWNYQWGGIAGGTVLYFWFKNAWVTVTAGWLFGLTLTWFRFCVVPDGTPKLCMDYDRPFYGVLAKASSMIMPSPGEHNDKPSFWYFAKTYGLLDAMLGKTSTSPR